MAFDLSRREFASLLLSVPSISACELAWALPVSRAKKRGQGAGAVIAPLARVRGRRIYYFISTYFGVYGKKCNLFRPWRVSI